VNSGQPFLAKNSVEGRLWFFSPISGQGCWSARAPSYHPPSPLVQALDAPRRREYGRLTEALLLSDAGAWIGAGTSVLLLLLGGSGWAYRRKARAEREEDARKGARKLMPHVDGLYDDARNALRTRHCGRLKSERAELEEWPQDALDKVIAGLDETEWRLLWRRKGEIQRTLREDFFPNLLDDGALTIRAAAAAYVVADHCNEVLFLLDRAAIDHHWDPNRKLELLAEHFRYYKARHDAIPIDPELREWFDPQQDATQEAQGANARNVSVRAPLTHP
jgi:hypothetical protein